MPAHAGGDSLRQVRHRLLFGCFGVEQVQHAEAILVSHERDRAAVIRKIELIHVPGNVAAQVVMLFARGIDVCQSLKLGVFVGCNVDAFAIFAKLAATISDLCATLWSDKGFLAVARVYNP